MTNTKKYFNQTTIIFCITALLYALGNFIWWKLNTPIIPVKLGALYFYDIFKDGWLFYNAPLMTWIMRGMFFIFGKEYYDLIIIFVNYIFFLVPLYFIYKIGVELKDKETGNIAMILFALVPAVYGMSRQYGHLNYNLIAIITFNIYCLIKTDCFRDKKWSIWYGISVGLGLMIKDIFIAYFLVPFLYIAIAGLKGKTDKTKIVNIMLVIALGSLIAGWHYFRSEIMIKKVLYDAFRDTAPLFTFESLRVTTIGLWEYLLSPPLFIMFLMGLIFFIWKYKGEYKNVILLWFIVPWAGITIMPHYKLPEYGLGFIPAMILIGAVFISYMEKKYIKKMILILLIFIGIFQYIKFSFFYNKMIGWQFKYENCSIHYKMIDWQFKYRNHSIRYFNNNLYQAVDIVETGKLVKYLKNKYSNNKFYIVNINRYIDNFELLNQMFLNDIYNKKGYLFDDKVFLFDIILFVGKIYTAEQIFNFHRDSKMEDPFEKKVFAYMLKDDCLCKKIENVLKRVKENYHMIDIFYLDDVKNKKIKITLFGRKDKFSQILQ